MVRHTKSKNARRIPVWIPLDVEGQDGRKVTLSGKSLTKLTGTVITPKNLEVLDRDRNRIGRLRSIDNFDGVLQVVFYLNLFDEPVPSVSGKFLLGLSFRGRHTAVSLYETKPRPIPDGTYVGMLGEEF